MVTRFRIRLYLLACMILAGFGLLVSRLYDIQIEQHDVYVSKLPGRSELTVRIPGIRGEIKDRNGITLVDNVPNYELRFDLKEIVDDYKSQHKSVPKYSYRTIVSGQEVEREEIDIVQIVKEAVLPGLADLGMVENFNSRQLRVHYRSTQGVVPYTYRRNLTFKEFATFAEHNLDLPGVTVTARGSRHYVYDALACHILGYVNLPDIQRVAVEKRQEYDHYVGDDFGVAGIEKTLDHHLQGKPGKRVLEKDEKGRIVGEFFDKYEAPKPGADVYLTLDARIQMIAEESLRKIGRGAAVVIDPRTGEILAMASVPSYNPNVFIPSVSAEDYRNLTSNPTSPFLDRSINPYSPGSTCKIPVALAGCLSDSYKKNFYCSGGVQYGSKYMKCWCLSKGYTHGSVDVSTAIKYSCNAFFYQYANDTGIANIQTMASLLGLGRPTGIPIPGESGGLIPDPTWLRLQGLQWSDAFTALVSIGQGATEITPLQMASVTASVSNGGKVYRPKLVSKVVEKDGTVAEQTPPELKHDLTKEGLTAEQVEMVKHGMWRVVNEPGGTAGRASSEITTISGKTGTTQTGKPDEPTNAWFIAFAPYDEPELAVCVFVQNGYSGGGAASPIAKNIIESALAMKQGMEITVSPLEPFEGNFERIMAVSFTGEGLTEYASDDADSAVDVADVMPSQLRKRSSSSSQAPVAKPSITSQADREGSVSDQNKKANQRWKNLRPLRFLFGE